MVNDSIARAMRVLVGYDGSSPARRALEHALKRASAAKDELLVLTVIPPAVRGSSLARMMPAGVELPREMSGTFEETARRRLDDVVTEAKKRGVSAKAEVRAGEAADEIIAAAKAFGAEEIVIGHKSFEGPEFKLGPNAALVVRDAGVPVTVVR